jgi:hypothetical protein
VINGSEIQQDSCVKYLGVYIDERLNFECHAEKTIAKINKRLGILRRINQKMTKESKEIYLKSIILPVTDYCSSIIQFFSDSNKKSIQRLMNKAMRVVLQLPRDSSVAEMHQNLNLLTVNQRINFNAMKLINKTIAKGLPCSLRSKFKTRSQMRERTLRSDSEYDVPAWNDKIAKRSIYVQSVKQFNDMMTNHYDEKLTYLANVKAYVMSND